MAVNSSYQKKIDRALFPILIQNNGVVSASRRWCASWINVILLSRKWLIFCNKEKVIISGVIKEWRKK